MVLCRKALSLYPSTSFFTPVCSELTMLLRLNQNGGLGTVIGHIEAIGKIREDLKEAVYG